MLISLRPGMEKSRDELIHKLVDLQYERNDINFIRNKFRVRGDVIEVTLGYTDEYGLRIEMYDDEVEYCSKILSFLPSTSEINFNIYSLGNKDTYLFQSAQFILLSSVPLCHDR